MQSDTGSNRTISTSLRKLAPAAAKISSNTRGKRKNVGPRSSLNPRAAIADVRRPPHQVAQSPSLAARPRPAESQLPSPQDQCIVRAIASSDRRVRIETAPPLPPGWCGKQHACDVLSRLASHPVLIFLDADVRLKSGAIARMTAFLEQSGSALASGVPEQVTHTFSERLLVPLIHFVLLGFLPIRRMRIDPRPALGAGCGQVFVALRHAYVASGGHRAIRDSLHDGLKLPRVFRSAGFRTDLFDATDIASCRMFSTGAEVWRGLARNAGEGLGSPRLIGVASLLLCRRADSSARFIGRSLSEWLEVQACFVVGGNWRRLFATPAWCPSISTARRRSAASSDCNLCALGDPVVCLFPLDGAPTRHLEGPRVFSGVHNVNIFFTLLALVASASRWHRLPSN